MKIVADAQIPFISEYFQSYGELVLKDGRTLTNQDVKDADILLVRSVTRVNKELLDHTTVKFVGSMTAGADHLDTHWLEDHGIQWTIATGFNAPPVADYVVCVIAALQTKGLLASENIRTAVVGLGNVGALVAKQFNRLGFHVILNDPLRAEKENDFISTPFEDLTDLDLISLHVPLTRSGKYPTEHFIEEVFLKRQKPGCILLNTSRGAIINSQHLLQSGQHLKWCLDVWENEPDISKDLLKQAFIATPHIAGYSAQARIRGMDIIYRFACEKNIIPPKQITPLQMPYHEYLFNAHHWQEVVLGILNPLTITQTMRASLLNNEKDFDCMRLPFHSRNEFSYTKLNGKGLTKEDVRILQALDLKSWV